MKDQLAFWACFRRWLLGAWAIFTFAFVAFGLMQIDRVRSLLNVLPSAHWPRIVLDLTSLGFTVILGGLGLVQARESDIITTRLDGSVNASGRSAGQLSTLVKDVTRSHLDGIGSVLERAQLLLNQKGAAS